MKNHLLISLLGLAIVGCSPNQPDDPTANSNTVSLPAPTMSAQEINETTDQFMSNNPPTMEYTLAEVADHANPPDDCWIAIEGKVYDVSGFAEAGHGGGEAVYEGCGIDATQLYNTRPMGSGTPHSQKAREFLPNFYIGDVAEESTE